MALWIANPQNILTSNGGIKLPPMAGWWARVGIVANTNIYCGPNVYTGFMSNITTGSQAAGPILVNDGLLPSDNSYLATLTGSHLGNGNNTLTLEGGAGVSSHQVSDNALFPLGYAVTPGTELTFSLSAIGTVNNSTSSICSVIIIWVDSSNYEISRSKKTLRCPFGQKLRVAVTANAPTGTVKCILQIDTSQTCIVSDPVLVLGDMILSNNDINYLQENELLQPTISGDRWFGNPVNLMPVEPFFGGPARMYSWRDSTNALLTPTNGVLTIPSNTTYTLKYTENVGTTTTTGVDILPNTAYIFSIFETGTSPTILLKFYDPSGTVLISSLTIPPLTSLRRVASFVTPSNAANMVIVATAGGSSCTLSLPTLIKGVPYTGPDLQTSIVNLTSPTHLTGDGSGDPGPLPPIFVGTFTIALDVPGANNQLVTNQLLVSTSSRGFFDSALGVVGSNNQLTTKVLDVQYPSRTLITKTLDALYSDFALFNKSIDIQHPLRSLFTKTIDAQWVDLHTFSVQLDAPSSNNVLVSCTLDVATPNNALFNSSIISRTPNNCVVTITRDFSWLNSQRATTILDAQYALNQTFHQNLDVVYDLRQLVHKDVQFIWGINKKSRIIQPATV